MRTTAWKDGQACGPRPAGATLFATTHWSLVLAARDGAAYDQGDALETLCRGYWPPLYAYIRSQGRAPQDAEDLTQAFFAHLIRRDFLSRIGQNQGKFRSFLLACLNHFLIDDWDKSSALKRGGGQVPFSLNTSPLDAQARWERAGCQDPVRTYERQWALTVLDQVLAALRAEFIAAEKGAMFAELEPFLLGERVEKSYTDSAAELRTSESAIKMMVYRMRQRYRELFREEIARTVTSDAELEEEIQYLRSVLRG